MEKEYNIYTGFTAYRFDGKVISLFRILLFLCFSIISFRLILLHIVQSSIHARIFLLSYILIIGLIAYYNRKTCIYLILLAVPLISGLKTAGFIDDLPVISLGFAAFFLSWFLSNILTNRTIDKNLSETENLADILSGIILASLIVLLSNYPIDVIFFEIIPINNYNYGILPNSFKTTYIFLQGLFFYRITCIELKEKENINQTFYAVFIFQIVAILFFTFLQVVFDLPKNNRPFFLIHSPFDDIHAYGSYLSLMFFISLYYFTNNKSIYFLLLTGLSLLCIVFSYSRAAWLATFVVLSYIAFDRLKKKAKIILFGFAIFIIAAFNIYPNLLLNSDSIYLNRLGRTVVIKNYFEDKTVLGRWVRWKAAMKMIREFPISGIGIGYFNLVSDKYMDPNEIEQMIKLRKKWKPNENAHNYYLQLCAEIGITALLIFLTILFYIFKRGRQILKTYDPNLLIKGLIAGLSAYLLTMATGHPLLLSNQQILFWYIIATISLIYMNNNKTVVFNKIRKKYFDWIKTSGICLLFFVYLFGSFSSASPIKHEYGIYGYEKSGDTEIRWTNKKSRFYEKAGSDIIKLEIIALEYNIEDNKLNYSISINDKLNHDGVFKKPGRKQIYFVSEGIKDKLIKFKTHVNKTFVPKEIGLNSDTRRLGIAIQKIDYLNTLPDTMDNENVFILNG